jgi:S1-C subfamily serine protease
MGRLLEFGEVRRGMLGVMMRSMTPGLAADLGFGTSTGALVLEVTPDSAGERAGLEIYDIIVGIDGERVSASNALRNRIAMKLPGEAVELAIVRDETERTVRAVLDARDIDADRRLDSNALPPPGPLDGMRLLADSDQRQGVTVRAIARGSLAEDADVRPGDLIVAINQQPVSSIDDAMLLASQTWTVVLEIQRGEQRLLRVLR